MKTRNLTKYVARIAGSMAIVGVLAAAGLLLPTAVWSSEEDLRLEALPREQVRRTDLSVTVTASGEINSAENTLIECEIEDFSERTAGGQRISTSGRSVIIELVPEGTVVQKGDVLCSVDGSEYVEMIRQKRIENDQARADLEKAELDLQAARITLKEYVDGTRLQKYQEYEGQIALAEGQYQRQLDRLDWADRMRPLGYVSGARYEQEKQLLLSDELALQKVKDAFEAYQQYTEPKMVQTYESQVSQALSTVTYMRRRLERKEERLDEYETQLRNCTIRAPHAGRVVYAEDDDDPPLVVGAAVHEHMDLFYLPNLEKMQVEVTLNETIVERVEKGMAAKVRIVAFPGMVLDGVVEKVEQMPHVGRYSWAKDDVKDYRTIISVESAEGLMPKMDARVEIFSEERPDALVIPASAMVLEGGEKFCYVATDAGVERRPVDVKPGTIELLEVVDGLAEGEEVVLDPASVELAGLVVAEKAPPVAAADRDGVDADRLAPGFALIP